MPSAPLAPGWDQLYELAAAQEGLFSTAQAATAGYSPELLIHHVHAGKFRRVQRGIYRIVHFPAGEQEDLVAAWLWSNQQGTFSHQTALFLHELSDVLPARVHLIAHRARQHRCALTPEEQRLSLRIRGCQLGVWFRAQVSLGGFIVDFLAPSAHLAVEVDGGYHSVRRAADARRDARLARMGYRVLRLEAEVVSHSHRIEEALERIRAALGV